MFAVDRSRDREFYIAGWCALALILLALGVAAFTGFNPFALLRPCAFHALTGLYCPGCGGTRAVRALLAGHPWLSLRFHPLVLPAAFVCAWFMVSQTVERVSRGRIRIGMHVRDAYIWLVLAVVVVNFLVKNLVLLIGGVDLLA